MTETDKNNLIKEVLSEEEKQFTAYLDEVASLPLAPSIEKRSFCCNTSRSLYCPECYKLLVPTAECPLDIPEGDSIELPFVMDIILGRKERRNSSSGVQMMVIRQMMTQIDKEIHRDIQSDGKECPWWTETRLFDLNKGDPVPTYPEELTSMSSTFVLFPSKNSVPLSSVANKIKRLVILDIKWTRSGIVQLDPSLSMLPAVHLEYPPKVSQFWRWHNGGDGMLSTMEAIYFAAIEMSAALGWDKERREKIRNIMWIFALQRRAIIHQHMGNSAEQDALPLPFSMEGKKLQKSFRVRKDGKDSAARQKRNGQSVFYERKDKETINEASEKVHTDRG
ncbi:DTW domain containing protein [Nitzschia inconspicua]|uniref:tRNA-uridine aminocarboxypropyltransferase 1 n=1 Tax=Nitzschia inconspicua TaxID=303405 RepID=A0A9K3KQ90_9STRA|nr:DTW domain containing protein [Nitzschia inconspicua]